MSVYRPRNKAGEFTSTIYLYDFQVRGRRFNGSTGEQTKRKALAVEAIKKAEAKADAKRLDSLKHEPMTIDVATGQYYTKVGQYHVNAETTLRDLTRLVQFFGKHTRLIDIADGKVSELVARRRGDGVSNATVNRSATQVLRKVFQQAKVWGERFDREPIWRQHMLPEPKERIRELTDSEEAALLAGLRPDYRPVWLFALASGARLREAVSLTWPMVDWGSRTIRLVVKGGKPHVIPISDEVREVLWPLQGDHPTAVFTYVRKTPARNAEVGKRYPITYEGLKTQWKRDKKRAGIADFRWHDNRHTAASRILRETGNLRVVQQLLGHEDIATTTKYAHSNMDDVREAMNRVTKSRRKSRSRLSEGEKSSKIKDVK